MVENVIMDLATDNRLLVFNGINGATGTYEFPPISGPEMAQFIQGEHKPENLQELQFRHRQATEHHLGVKEGVDPTDLAQAGWGAICPYGADPAVLEALEPLLRLRRTQAGDYFRLFDGSDGYRPGESKNHFLARHGVGPGPADPAKMPYYLLIIGDPNEIPYTFQYQLDVQYAVGRIYFPSYQEYADYARSVVDAETEPRDSPRRVAFFAAANPDDPATALSAEHLVEPLHTTLCDRHADWEFALYQQEQATKPQLTRLLGGDQTPALLFTATHGMAFPNGHPQQAAHQGALLCQDWPGPKAWQETIPQDFYLAGDDLSQASQLSGLVTFGFACYGAGTPQLDDFARQAFKERTAIAPRAFVADLPRRALGHARGGALAFIGHVERAWGCSFMWPGAHRQLAVFESALDRLLAGYPVGAALEYFNERYAELATVLSMELEEMEYGKQVDPYELAGMWTANNDARSYTIVGDPAVRLPATISFDEERATPVWEVHESEGEIAHGAGHPSPTAAAVHTRLESPTIAETPLAMTVTTHVCAASQSGEYVLKARTLLHDNGHVENFLPAELAPADDLYLTWHAQILAAVMHVGAAPDGLATSIRISSVDLQRKENE